MARICLGIILHPGKNSSFIAHGIHKYRHTVFAAREMTNKKTPMKHAEKPVIYVHAKDHSPLNKNQVQALRELDLPLFSHLEIEGAHQTANSYNEPGALLAELHKNHPGRPVIFLRAGLQPSPWLLEQLAILEQQAKHASVLVPLSNAEPSLNPFAGLRAPANNTDHDFASLVSLLAPGILHMLTEWPDHLVYFTTMAVECLVSQQGKGTLVQQMSRSEIKLVAADHLFILDPDARVFARLDLKPYESLCPPPFGVLSAKLQAWMDAGIGDIPLSMSRKPATLHITHSWGGGVAQWIGSFIQADDDHRHFQLRSENARANHAFGQKLSLYAGDELRCPIASWWLQPPIESVAETDVTVKKILLQICNRFEIGRVFISSLIGHSLDVLRTDLPTTQILHDHFPVWPLLGVDPTPYLADNGRVNLDRALSDHKMSRNFVDRDEAGWSRLRSEYLQALTDSDAKIVAPGQWVIDLQNRLEPRFTELQSKVIPHGFPELDELRPVAPKPREDGRLRLIILGRMQEGKGSKLLLSALPRIAEYVQVYLLGTGKPGEAFFGIPGVDVILEYDRTELGSLLNMIGPDFAALLSVVPETFSYTLSELQQSGIPTIATRLGSFPDRIVHDQTGWLVDVNADSLVEQVIALSHHPVRIESVRENLPPDVAGSPVKMVRAYNQFCPPKKTAPPHKPTVSDFRQVQWAAADYQLSLTETELQNTDKKREKLRLEIDEISDWARQEQKNSKAWRKEGLRLQGELETKAARVLELNKDLEIELNKVQQLESDYQCLSDKQALILRSTSWKITRPFRGARRLIKNLMLARAWNPLRWPWLISSLVRTIHTLGLAGTLREMQSSQTEIIAQSPTEYPSKSSTEVPAKPLSVNDPTTKLSQVSPGPFGVFEQPDASIIIPVYNQWPYTAACLASLCKAKSRHSFEILIVDDQSSDETAEQLALVKGITCLRNNQNLGFVGSCNRGAKHARGEYLVLLNNDTEVTDNWLDELIDTFKSEPQAGLVGSRLVYPDGKLQESGSMIFNDASGWNYGRGDDPERPEYQYLREVDYCSGACIALKTRFFHELGGLDERYSPAYYEDTDLAFKVRKANYKVLVQPWSIVTHYEGATSGTNTSTGIKKYQLINQEKFLERWQSELELQPPPVPDPYHKPSIRKACFHRNKGRILFIDARTPEPDQDSGSVRLTNLMRICLELGYGVTFFADNRVYAGHYTRDLQKIGVEVLFDPWLESLSEFFRDRVNEFDYIFISRHYVATNYLLMLKRYCSDVRFIFDTVDLHYLREQRMAEINNSRSLKIAALQTRRAELNVIEAANATLVVSSAEKAVLAEDSPGSRVHILSNIHDVPGRDKAFSERRDICFIGGYQHPPNLDAVQWFVTEVWPLIHEQIPDMKFHLIGSKAPDRIRALEGNGVIFHGYVESLEPFLDGCRLAVAPLRYGAGVKGKVNMSMAHGQPMVVTSTAAEGLFGEHEREYLLADDAESFAHEVVRLYQDETLWYRLSDASSRNAEDHFSMNAARNSLVNLLNSFED